MKQYFLIGIFAVALVLGSGCKKEKIQKDNASTTEVKDAKPADAKPTVFGTLAPGGSKPSFVGYDAGLYPHNTGLCACSQCVWLIHHYSSCDGYEYPNGSNGPTSNCRGCKLAYTDFP